MPAEPTTDIPVSDFATDIVAIQRIDAVPRILDIVSRATGMGFAAVARVTTDRWICCASLDNIGFGLQPGGELKIETTICNEIRDHLDPVVIDHVADDAVFCGHHTPAMYGFQSYISVPIILPGGKFFGTLCAIDPRPARLNNPETIGTFKLFAELIAIHLDALDRLDASEARLLDERKVSELREQFIAVLGHDLRNPLAAIASGARLMTKAKSVEDTVKLAGLMQQTVNRMAKLIDNVLDFARGRLGGGLTLQRRPEILEGVLDQVATEMRSTHPDRDIETKFDIKQPINCDPQRLAQLFSNLLGNALDHGSKERPVVARANDKNGVFELSIANAGDTIPPETVAKLFHPFYRGTTKGPSQGLGLGLFIASEIARAHDGTLDVVSAEGETHFTFRMPAG
jgi:signal transduction histidine kinase